MSRLKETIFKDQGALIPFLKKMLKQARRYPRRLAGLIAFMSLVAVIEAIYPLVWLHFIDNIIIPAASAINRGEDTGYYASQLIYYGMVYISMGIIQVTGVRMFIIHAGYLEEYVMYDMRKNLFGKLQDLSFSFYDRSASGWLLSRITSDTTRVTEVITWGLIEAVWGSVMIIACLTAMFIYNWQLALIVLFALPFLILISIHIRRLILKYSRISRRHNSEITASYNEHINGVEVNKSTAQEYRVAGEFGGLSEKMRRASYRSSYYTALYLPLVIFAGSLAAAAVLYVGSSMAVAIPAGITVGVLAAFISYATRIFEPIFDISRFYAMAQGAISAGERIFSLLDEKVEVKDHKDAAEFNTISGAISFENVTFNYLPGKPVLNNVSFDIKAGESIALVGETGGGKSTIINLICRFYEPVSGVIRIDGEDYMTKSIRSLRSQMGIVLQTPHLFSGTIRDNLHYGKADANDDELKKALIMAGGTELLSNLELQVGEGGENLSAGQKQVVSFARAILADPRILIMDEATSSIDTMTESIIQKGVETLIRDRTSIIIAHRLSTIRNCHRIFLVKEGEISEAGSHEELMRLKGDYYSLYVNQMRKVG